MRIPLKKVLPLVPNVFHDELRKSRYYAANSDALVLQSDEDRKQAANLNKCFRKLNDMMRETATNALPGETSASQKKRVERLQVVPCLSLEVIANSHAAKPRTTQLGCR